MEKEKKWNVGDFVTYKNPKDCLGGVYNSGGIISTEKGKITSFYSYNSSRECWRMRVTHSNNESYNMLEDEFEEFTNDVIPVKKENLIGRWIKALINYPMAGNVLKGEYGILISYNIADFPSQKGYAVGHMNKDSFELMPIDFNFNTIYNIPESKFNIGDVVNTDNSGKNWCNNNDSLEYMSINSLIQTNKSITEKHFNTVANIWMYRIYSGTNWFTENCISLFISKQQKIPKQTEPINSDDIAIPENSYIEELLEYANKHYTIGVAFSSIFDDGGEERKIVPWNENQDNSVRWVYIPGDNKIYTQNGMGKAGKSVCSNPTIWKDGEWAPIIIEKKMSSEEELLNEAKKRYPIGSRFIIPTNKVERLVTTDNYKWDNTYGKKSISAGEGWVYLGGKWAEIIPTHELKSVSEGKAIIDNYINPGRSISFKQGLNSDDRIENCYKSVDKPIYIAGIDPYQHEIEGMSLASDQGEWIFYTKKPKEKKEEIKIEHQLPILINKNNKQRKLITI